METSVGRSGTPLGFCDAAVVGDRLVTSDDQPDEAARLLEARIPPPGGR